MGLCWMDCGSLGLRRRICIGLRPFEEDEVLGVVIGFNRDKLRGLPYGFLRLLVSLSILLVCLELPYMTSPN
jgi:hypothetical protein